MFKLSNKSYSTLKKVNLSEMTGKITFSDEGSGVETSDFSLLMIILNEEITSRGMDDEDTANAYGRELYNLYDELLSQKSN